MNESIEIKILKQKIKDLKNILFEQTFVNGPRIQSQQYIHDICEENGRLKKELEDYKNIYTKVGLEMQEINREQTKENARLHAENQNLTKLLSEIAG